MTQPYVQRSTDASEMLSHQKRTYLRLSASPKKPHPVKSFTHTGIHEEGHFMDSDIITRILGDKRMSLFSKILSTAALASALSVRATLVSYTFTDAPLIGVARTNAVDNNPSNGPNRASSPTTLAPGVAASDFAIVNSSSLSQILATSADESFRAAQISGLNNSGYQWQPGFESVPYFEFTMNQVTALSELTLSIRDGIEWAATNGTLSAYASNRQSTVTIRSSLDGFAANIGSEFSPNGTGTPSPNTAWDLRNMDLTGLNALILSPTNVTFRIYTKSTGTDFHRTQIQSVELTGAAIPEPGTLALAGIAGLALVLGLRRGKRRA